MKNTKKILKHKEIKTKIRSYILNNYLFGYTEDELQDDTSLLEMGVLDSIGILELTAYFEREYKISIQDEEIVPDNFDSIDCLIKFLVIKTNIQETETLRYSI